MSHMWDEEERGSADEERRRPARPEAQAGLLALADSWDKDAAQIRSGTMGVLHDLRDREYVAGCCEMHAREIREYLSGSGEQEDPYCGRCAACGVTECCSGSTCDGGHGCKYAAIYRPMAAPASPSAPPDDFGPVEITEADRVVLRGVSDGEERERLGAAIEADARRLWGEWATPRDEAAITRDRLIRNVRSLLREGGESAGTRRITLTLDEDGGLSYEAMATLNERFCLECGRSDPRCQCWNDE